MRVTRVAAAVSGLIVLAVPAQAHHPLGGLPMETFTQGILSGLGHPILGFDHLFFVLAMGAAAGMAGIIWRGIVAYIAAMLAGCLLIATGGTLPVQEVLIAASVVSLGLLVASQRQVPKLLLTGMFAAFGLFHGAAFGDAIAAQESAASLPVLTGYLLGLGSIQAALALGASAVTRRLRPMTTRLGGAMIAGAGLLLFLEQIEGLVLAQT